MKKNWKRDYDPHRIPVYGRWILGFGIVFMITMLLFGERIYSYFGW